MGSSDVIFSNQILLEEEEEQIFVPQNFILQDVNYLIYLDELLKNYSFLIIMAWLGLPILTKKESIFLTTKKFFSSNIFLIYKIVQIWKMSFDMGFANLSQ